jgi:hypothetical protein
VLELAPEAPLLCELLVFAVVVPALLLAELVVALAELAFVVAALEPLESPEEMSCPAGSLELHAVNTERVVKRVQLFAVKRFRCAIVFVPRGWPLRAA